MVRLLRRDLHVFEIARFVVNADTRGCDPAGEFTRLGDRVHQAGDEFAVVLRRQPLADVAIPGRLVDKLARGRGFDVLNSPIWRRQRNSAANGPAIDIGQRRLLCCRKT